MYTENIAVSAGIVSRTTMQNLAQLKDNVIKRPS